MRYDEKKHCSESHGASLLAGKPYLAQMITVGGGY